MLKYVGFSCIIPTLATFHKVTNKQTLTSWISRLIRSVRGSLISRRSSAACVSPRAPDFRALTREKRNQKQLWWLFCYEEQISSIKWSKCEWKFEGDVCTFFILSIPVLPMSSQCSLGDNKHKAKGPMLLCHSVLAQYTDLTSV